MKISSLIPSLILMLGCASPPITPTVQPLESPTSALLQAISVVNEKTVWISGHEGTFVRSVDQGKNWELFKHPTGDTLQFRDIHAFDDNNIVLMSAGPGPLSRIFSFQAPDQWQENFVMEDSLGFLDCIDFWDDKRGIAYGDAIDKYPYILLTSDGGLTWSRADSTEMPFAGKGEGGFAASGTCVTTGENGKAWIATGAGGNSRFLITADYGQTWDEVDSPLVTGEAAGNTSISFVDEVGVVTGGDLLKPSDYTENNAFSTDNGSTWRLGNQPKTTGAFYGSAIAKVNNQVFAFACGPNGLDVSDDLGESWSTLDTLNYWAVSMFDNIGYASGKGGKILRISLQP